MSSLEEVQELAERMRRLVRGIHAQNMQEKPGKLAPKRYSMKETASLVGRTYNTIRNAEKEGKLKAPELDDGGRRLGYTLADINVARELFGTRLRREPEDDVVRLAISNFKGGAGKSTSAIHFAQRLAEKGLKILLVDCDPQASTTSAFGYVPDDDIDGEDTLYPLLYGDTDSLKDAIRKTYWDGLDLIPACLDLSNIEYTLAIEVGHDSLALQRLKLGLDTIEDDYDLIILDPPPSMGMLSLSVMQAVNALLIPTPAALYDIHSTAAFLTMLEQTIELMEKFLGPFDLKFIRLLVTRLDEGSEIQIKLMEMLPNIIGNKAMRTAVRKTAALDRAGMYGRSLYEVSYDQVSRRTLNRAIRYFNRSADELLDLIRGSWPSQVEALRNEAKL